MALNTDNVLRYSLRAGSMFQFAQGHFLFQRVGVALLMVQLCLFVFGLPPFHIGIWLQTEPDMVALYALGFANVMWLLYGCLVRALVPQTPSPILYCLMAWVGWQVVVTCFAFTPYRSWFGPVEMEEGAAWHLCLLLVTMMAYPLWQVKSFRHVLMIWAAAVISGESLLHVLFNPHNNLYVPGSWIPAQWAAYLAFMVGYFWVMMMVGNYVRTPAVYMALIAFAADVMIISYNKSAVAMMPAAIVVSFGVFLWQRRKGAEPIVPGRRARMAAVALCLLPIGWIVFSAQYRPTEEQAKSIEPPHGMLNISHKDSALGSRVGLIQVGMSAMAHEPRRWLVGAGWGEFNDSMFKYALQPGVHMFLNGERRPNWGFVDGNAYHSHCQPLEALLALGVPGVVLWFAIPIVIILSIPARLFWACVPMLLLMNTVSFLWFQLPQCVPMEGMMLAALCHACPGKGERKGRRMLQLLGLTFIGVLMGLTVREQYVGMMYGERIYKGSRYLGVEEYPMPWVLSDMIRGGDRLRVSAMGFAMSLDKEHGDIEERQRAWYQHYMNAGHYMMMSPGIGARGRYLELWLQYKLLLNLGYPIFAPLGHEATQSVRETVVMMAKIAPLRDDLGSFYLLNFDDVTHNNKVLQQEILREILAANANYRPAMWLLGNLLVKTKDGKEEGEALIRKAIALHVEDVFAVTDEQLAKWK